MSQTCLHVTIPLEQFTMHLKDFKESMFTLNCDGTWKLASIVQFRWTHRRQLKMDLCCETPYYPTPALGTCVKNNEYTPKKISSNGNRLCKQTIYRADFNASHVSYASPRTTSTLSLYKIGFSMPAEETRYEIRNVDLLPNNIYLVVVLVLQGHLPAYPVLPMVLLETYTTLLFQTLRTGIP